RDEAAEDFAGNVDHAVVHREDFLRVVVLALAFEPGVETGQVLTVEEADHVLRIIGGRKRSEAGQDNGQDGKRKAANASAEHGGQPFVEGEESPIRSAIVSAVDRERQLRLRSGWLGDGEQDWHLGAKAEVLRSLADVELQSCFAL